MTLLRSRGRGAVRALARAITGFGLLAAAAAAAPAATAATAATAAFAHSSPVAPLDSPARGAEPGSELEIYVMTMGQGDLLWERFGHNALGVRNTRTGMDVVYNWGTFSFEQEDFLPRFLRGEMLYWMAPNDAARTVEAYRYWNRSVIIQELNLTPAQRDSVRRYVEWNALEANRYYRYDYYLDNCSTRVRDLVDAITGGAIRRATGPDTTTMTYRDHSLRLMDGMFWTRTGIDLGLGAPTDRPITAWEAMFIPMEVQRRLRTIRVPDATGALVPLVKSEYVLFEATRPSERMDVPELAGGGLVGGLLVAALLFALGYRTPGRVASTALSLTWSLVAGIFGLLLFLLWTVTQHGAAHENQNLFFVHPLWLLLFVLLLFVRSGPSARLRILYLVRLCVGLALVGGAVALTPAGQPSGEIAAFCVPVIVAVYLLVLRMVFLAQQAANAAVSSVSEGPPPRGARA